MSNEQTRDILEHARQFHRQVSEFYDQLCCQTEKERIKMLLEYMSRHEKNMAQTLEDFEHSAPAHLLQTCFKVGHPFRPCCDVIKELDISSDMSVDDVIQMGLEFDDCLIAVYQDLAENAPDEQARSVFQNLLELEQKEKRQLARNAQRVLDF
jgi:rubrerythrin